MQRHLPLLRTFTNNNNNARHALNHHAKKQPSSIGHLKRYLR